MKDFDKVKEFIKQYNMIEEDDSVIVGVSGGADSICLYKMLLELSTFIKINLFVVHIHHGIRGEEADRDMKFVKEMCDSDGVLCEVFKFNVPVYAKKNSLSEEEAGRILRYESFERVATRVNNNKTKIAVAHNLNDSGETFIHNLCRGSGLNGLTGISPCSGKIIRPLLCLTRENIEEYLRINNISFINDSTNFSEEYTRNKIRLKVLPYFEQHINSNSLSHICEAASDIDEALEYLDKISGDMYEKIAYEYNNCIYVDKRELQETDIFFRKRIIRLAINNIAGKLKDITRQHIMDILELSYKQTGKYLTLPYDISVHSEYDKIIFRRNYVSTDNEKKIIEITKNGIYNLENEVFEVEILDVKKDNINIKVLENSLKKEQKMYTKCFDYDKIDFTVQLRFRESGDYLVVNPNGDRKKLKSYFIDKKIPSEKRMKIPLIADGSHIIWIVGYRISEKYKITSNTKKIMIITRKDKNENAGQN